MWLLQLEVVVRTARIRGECGVWCVGCGILTVRGSRRHDGAVLQTGAGGGVRQAGAGAFHALVGALAGRYLRPHRAPARRAY